MLTKTMHCKLKYIDNNQKKMNDPYNTKLFPSARGTVKCVDDMGTIHIRWDCGSSLGVVYAEDTYKVITE